MFTLSLRERILVAAVLSAAVLGAAVKHWRDASRESLALTSVLAAQPASAPIASHSSLARTPPGRLHP